MQRENPSKTLQKHGDTFYTPVKHPDVFNKLIFQLKGADCKTGSLYSASFTDREILMLWVSKYPEHLYLTVFTTPTSFLIRQHAADSCFPLTDILFNSLALSGEPRCDALLRLFSAPCSVPLKQFLQFLKSVQRFH